MEKLNTHEEKDKQIQLNTAFSLEQINLQIGTVKPALMTISRKQPPVNNNQYNSTMTSLELYFYHEPLLNFSGPKDGCFTVVLQFIIMSYLIFSMFKENAFKNFLVSQQVTVVLPWLGQRTQNQVDVVRMAQYTERGQRQENGANNLFYNFDNF